ncbi:hypothetical protein C8J57DRAFT_1623422 [Mycena rebaudengoi]|nr:hypothetical protein C8J57DRAFT_1623422 [Mycena rebaudengoi]
MTTNIFTQTDGEEREGGRTGAEWKQYIPQNIRPPQIQFISEVYSWRSCGGKYGCVEICIRSGASVRIIGARKDSPYCGRGEGRRAVTAKGGRATTGKEVEMREMEGREGEKNGGVGEKGSADQQNRAVGWGYSKSSGLLAALSARCCRRDRTTSPVGAPPPARRISRAPRAAYKNGGGAVDVLYSSPWPNSFAASQRRFASRGAVLVAVGKGSQERRVLRTNLSEHEHAANSSAPEERHASLDEQPPVTPVMRVPQEISDGVLGVFAPDQSELLALIIGDFRFDDSCNLSFGRSCGSNPRKKLKSSFGLMTEVILYIHIKFLVPTCKFSAKERHSRKKMTGNQSFFLTESNRQWPAHGISNMNPASALLAFILFTVVATLHVPGCLPDEDATIVSEAMFPVPDLDNPIPRLENLTITHFTCPSRAQTQTESSELRGSQSGICMAGDTHNNSRRQSPIDLCGPMEGAELFGAGHEPTLSDCNLIDWEVWNSFVRPKVVPLLPREGLVLSIANNTCAFVVLNDDFSDTYNTCVGVITQVFFEVESRCNSPQDGFIGSVQSRRSPGTPAAHNWAVK